MEYDFYWISGSPNAWRAMLALEYKDVSYNSHRLDASKQEHKSSAFLTLNPQGKVPVLKHGDTVVCESIAIMAYLESVHPKSPLFGVTAAETGLVWQRIFEFVNGLRDLIDDGVVRPLSQGLKPDSKDALTAATIAVHESLARLEAVLGVTDYLAGDRVSAADFTVVPNLLMLMRLGIRPDVLALELRFNDVRSTYPAIAKWLARLEALPAFDAAYPPHWLLSSGG
ncbi:glutathione S-transferase family protein [Pseudomonas sp. HY13-MNA-CIBAN-0226]|uniref:glutathione S-transferase family protein n=1 Tax=Pseudomonas sp. HY13-MNA-CIBAN-0226 TaxID=3140473 RepID=UPI0033331D37